MRSERSQSGASAIELAVVLLLIVIFIAVAAVRIWELRMAAERNGVEYLAGTLRSLLATRVITTVARDGLDSLPTLAGMNPITLLVSGPTNYLGELSGVDPADVAGYRWYFDTDSRMLVYRVANAEYFETDLRGPPRIRWQVRLSFADADNDERFDPKKDQVLGLDFVAMDQYRWLEAPE